MNSETVIFVTLARWKFFREKVSHHVRAVVEWYTYPFYDS